MYLSFQSIDKDRWAVLSATGKIAEVFRAENGRCGIDTTRKLRPAAMAAIRVFMAARNRQRESEVLKKKVA